MKKHPAVRLVPGGNPIATSALRSGPGPRSSGRWLHRWLPFAALAALMVAAADPVEVVTVRLTRGDIVRYVALPGSLRANQQVTVQARVAGYVKSITVDRGDRVQAGQTLAEIEVPELLVDQTRHLAEVRIAEVEVRRLDAARQKSPDLVTPQVQDAAIGRLDIARAQLQQVETLLHYARLTAPFAGVVTTRFVDPGAFVPAGSGGSASSIVTLADTSVLRAQVAVPETEAIFVQTGQPVRVTVEGLGQTAFPAAISRHSDAIDDATHTLWVEADLPNSDRKLRPGMYATVRLGLEKHSGALLVPANALVAEKTAQFVFLAADGRSRKTPVKIGFQDGTATEILSGLPADAMVIANGKTAPADGAAIRIKEGP